MSIFTLPDDLRISLAVQLVQLEKEDVPELLRRGHYYGLNRQTNGPMALWSDPETVTTVLSVRNLCRDILNQRTEIGRTHISLVARLSQAYTEHATVTSISCADVSEDGWVSTVSKTTSTNNSVSAALLVALDDLYTVIERNMEVKTCEECGNPYLPGKGRKPRFCSDRCGNRVRARRFTLARKQKEAEAAGV